MTSMDRLNGSTLAQLQREKQMMTDGHDRFLDRQAKLKDLSIAPANSRLLKDALAATTEALRIRLDEACAADGRPFDWVLDLKSLDTELLSYLGLVNCMEGVGMAASRTSVLRNIGGRVEMEHFSVQLKAYDKSLHDRITSLATSNNSSSEHRRKAVRHIAAKEGFVHEKWSQVRRKKAAAPILSAILEASDVFEMWTQIKDNKTVYRIGLTEQASEGIADINQEISWNEPVFTPMITPPKPWDSDDSGCYLDPALASTTPLVRHMSPKQRGMLKSAIRSGRMQPALDALNAIQATRYTMNTYVLAAVEWAWENSLQPGDSFPQRDKLEHIKFPENYSELSDDDKKGIRLKAQDIRAINKQVDADRSMMTMDLRQARDLANYEHFYLPHSFDFRGRIYPVCNFNTHRSDHIKSLFTIADKKPITESGARWIAIQVANTGDFGKISKQSFEDRVQWVINNADRIAEIGNDFEGTYDGDDPEQLYWSKADKPFAFLAACREFFGFWVHGTDYESGLPINLDGSNSGIQHFSAASCTETDGALVNLVPGDKPRDIYQAVADKVTDLLKADDDPVAKEWLDYGVTRKVVKRNVMTYGYSSGIYGFTDQLMEDLMIPLRNSVRKGDLAKHPFSTPGKAARKLANANWTAINQVVVGAADGMRFFQAFAHALADVNQTMTWFTPVGFPVDNAYYKNKAKRLRIYLYDKQVDSQVRTSVVLNMPDTRTVDKRKCGAAVSPNMIHSLDSSHLMSTVLKCLTKGVRNFMLIHDSFGTVPADTDKLFMAVREAFVAQYDGVCIYSFITDQILEHIDLGLDKQAPTIPTKGSLDIKAVLNSDYCFA
jgi:DNA-directed RNA polymerase